MIARKDAHGDVAELPPLPHFINTSFTRASFCSKGNDLYLKPYTEERGPPPIIQMSLPPPPINPLQEDWRRLYMVGAGGGITLTHAGIELIDELAAAEAVASLWVKSTNLSLGDCSRFQPCAACNVMDADCEFLSLSPT